VPEGFIFEQLCNHRHRLTGSVDPNNGNAPSALYEYDALNRRIHKKTWDNSGDVAMDVKTLNDGWQPVQELNSALTPTANLLGGDGKVVIRGWFVCFGAGHPDRGH
jgi:hypothetical protein